MSAPVPQDWTDMIGHLNAAQVAEVTMKSPEATQVARDEATVRYSRSVDAMFGCLSRLRESQELGRISLLLSKRERR